jgi:hypothetical protein
MVAVPTPPADDPAAAMIAQPHQEDTDATDPVGPGPATGVPTTGALSASQLLAAADASQPSGVARVADLGVVALFDDEPSDGIIGAAFVAPDSSKGPRVPPPGGPEHDGPSVKEATGEIGERPERAGKDPRSSEPTIVTDLAAVHSAASAIAAASAAPSGDAASSSRELEIADVRRDAVAFTETEEAFFNKAEPQTHTAPRIESFDDLDEGYQPPKFWDRVFGRKKP